MIFGFYFYLKPSTAQPRILLFCVLLRLLTPQIFLGPPDPRVFALTTPSVGYFLLFILTWLITSCVFIRSLLKCQFLTPVINELLELTYWENV